MTKPKALFIHISKTAGSSISKAPFIILQGTPKMSPKIAVNDIETVKFSFSITRNPYTRFTSASLNHGYATPETFEEWVTTTFVKEYKERFEKWDMDWQTLLPQYNYLVHNREMDVDFVGSMENLKEDWKEICSRVGETFELPYVNRNTYPNHSTYHTEKTLKIIREAYKEDFRLIGYSTDPLKMLEAPYERNK